MFPANIQTYRGSYLDKDWDTHIHINFFNLIRIDLHNNYKNYLMNYVTGFKMCLYLNENKMNYLHVKKKRKRKKKTDSVQ